MSDSESGSTSDDEPPPDVPAVQQTPDAKPRPSANRASRMFPLSPAWIKSTVKPKQKLESIGSEATKITPGDDVVLFTFPAGVKVQNLDGKRITLPSLAGARSSVEKCRLDIVCDPPESNADLHLLGMAGGTADSKAVSQVYSLQVPLADAAADEEPVDGTILDALLAALSKEPRDATDRTTGKKKKKKKSRSERQTTVKEETDVIGPEDIPLATAATTVDPPDTDGQAEPDGLPGDDTPKGKRNLKRAQSNAPADEGAAAGFTPGEDEAGGSKQTERKKKKRKKKKLQDSEVAIDHHVQEAVEGGVGAAEAGIGRGHFGEADAAMNVAAAEEAEDTAAADVQAEPEDGADAAVQGGVDGDADEAVPTKKKKKKRARSDAEPALGEPAAAEPAQAPPKPKKRKGSKKSL